LTLTPQRFQSLDAMRGIAVMGILLMNIISFAMPSEAYVNPMVGGVTSAADLWTWAIMSVLVDGKMRGLFSILFGASMLLVIERAEDKGLDGVSVHRRRMFWLLIFGLTHAYFIWYGDVLMIYALCGFMAMFLVHEEAPTLIKWGIGLIIANLVIWGSATALSLSELPEVPDAAEIATELRAYSGSYIDALLFRTTTEHAFLPPAIFISNALETMGLFALGMALFRIGFLTGDWDAARYARLAKRMYLIGLPPLIGFAAYEWANAFEIKTLSLIDHVFVPPFRIVVMIGHAAVAMLIVKRFADTPFMLRIEAAGRAALTNYIGTSILMTTLFYGHGFGQFGQLSRWQIYLIVPVVWVIMLLWSKPWLDRFRYGPLEWLWRSLARGERQTMAI
jgi:uncharacterized protein